MDYKKLDIWEASVFDFTDDAAILQQITSYTRKADYIEACNFLCRMQHIEAYARLEALATIATAKAWKEWDAMADEAQRHGLIID